MLKVSVIVPAFNKYNFTRKTITSIINQTYKEIEIILIDDGSNDDTYKLKHEFKNSIKYYYTKNIGASAARNLGIKKSTGDYLSFIDCDDIYEPRKIETSIGILKANPSYDFVYTDVYLINEKDDIIKIKFKPNNHPGSGNIVKKILLSDFTITNSTVVAKKECFDIIGGFDEKIFFAADRDVIVRLASKFKAFYIAQPLTGYRVGSGNIFKDLDNTLKEFLYLLDKNMKDLPNLSISFKNQCYSNVYYNFAKIYAKKNNMRLAKKYFFMSLKLFFFNRKSIKIFFGIVLIYLMPHKLNSYFKNINNY